MRDTFPGIYSDSQLYLFGDLVCYENTIYICVRSQSQGISPIDRDLWKSVGRIGNTGGVGIAGDTGREERFNNPPGLELSAATGELGQPGATGQPGFPPSAGSPQFRSLVNSLQAQLDTPIPQSLDWLHVYLVYTEIDNADWDETDAVIAIAKDPTEAKDCARNGCGSGAHKGGYTIDPEGKLIVEYLGLAAPGLAAGLLMSSVRGSYRR
jgi:hypothetical protein